MTDCNLEEFFEQFEDCCVPANTEGCTEFQWSAKGVGFGSFYFFYKDDELVCENEIMSKEFIKKMLCNMVDNCTLRDEPRKKSANYKSYSGDKFFIPPDQYKVETWLYQKAVHAGNEDAMLYFEEGHTGWKHIDE